MLMNYTVEMMTEKMVVYAIENKVNGKKYIGATTKSFKERYPGGIRAHHNLHVRRSVKKYGHSNFKVTLLAKNLESIEELQREEMKYIQEFDTCNKEKGYNKSLGGLGVRLPQPFSEEHCRNISKTKKAIGLNTLTRMTPRAIEIRNSKISKAFKGKNNPRYGMTKDKLKPETLEKLRQASLGENNPMYGKNIKDHMTEEAYEQWKKNCARPGAKNGNARKTIVVYKDKEYLFDYCQEAIKYFKDMGEPISVNWIYRGINEKHKERFHFFGYEEEYEKYKKEVQR